MYGDYDPKKTDYFENKDHDPNQYINDMVGVDLNQLTDEIVESSNSITNRVEDSEDN